MMTRRTHGILLVALVAIGGVGWYVERTPARAADPAPSPPAVPVTTTAVKVQDVPVLLDGLGTVQALNVVNIRPQVTGNLIALPAHEGQEVHKGDIVAEIDPRPYKAALDQAIAQRNEDAAQLKSAQQDLARYQALARRQFAPVQQVDDQTATVDKETAAMAADTAAIETAQINLGYCTIRAPVDGRVSLYQVDAGNLVTAGNQTTIISITQDKPIAVVFTLPEGDLAQVQAARARGPVPVQVASADTHDKVASGTLLTPDNTIDTSTGTISLKAIFENRDDALWPGQFVNARVQVRILARAVTLPTLAVQHGPNGMFVYTVKPDQTVALAPVQVSYEDGGLSVISKGLSGTDTVVLSGQSRLAPGTRVKATDAAAGGGSAATAPQDAAAGGRG
jgi:multidrug efflux system membrane fusion protein